MSRCKKCRKNEKYQEGYCKLCWEEVKAFRKRTDDLRSEINVASGGKRINILCIEDEPAVLESFMMILRILGCVDVVTAPDGPTGLSLLKPDIDMVITDDKMPALDIFQLLEKIREEFPMLPILVTGCQEGDGVVKIIHSGAFYYLRKPFLMEDLYEQVKRGIALRRKEEGK